ncbi:hypothetical protein C5167_013941 [Papaver somniferum]|uniref:DUF7086 domain-containing protein n=1 Tax=Papaver somniferum TaxID=3469 RepID=A0A4Y7J5R0_PAPSO|nr:uncharacterized protein LOC113361542 [Papaver somniferum]RZC55088.1 hypothetical protein C5167_013941 [Papaver somniferum]
MAKDKESVFLFSDHYEASLSSRSSNPPLKEYIDLELSLAPPGSSRNTRSSSSPDSHSSTPNDDPGRSTDNAVMPPPLPRLGDQYIRSSPHDICGGGVNPGDGEPADQGVVISYIPKNGGTCGDIPDSGGIGVGVANIPISGGFVSVGFNSVMPKDEGFGGGFNGVPIHGGSGVAIRNNSRRQARVRVRPENENAVDVVVPPFEWATNRFAKIHKRDDLISKGIHTISGEVQCKKCEHRCTLEFDLQSKTLEVGSFIYHNKENLCHRATDNWMSPNLETCPSCDQPNSLKPIIPSDKGMINWLFLLLGQMIGCCTLEQLKYFCDKNSLHRTGAKDRLIFLTYLSLCEQLDPTGPFKLNGC